MRRKLTALLLCLMMAASLVPQVAAAEPEAQSLLPYTGEPITLRIMGWESYAQPKADSMFGKWLQEKLGNITLEFEIPASDTETLLNLYLSTGDDMPDIMLYRKPDMFMENYGDGSRTLNLKDYAQYMPEFTARRDVYSHLTWYDTQGGDYYMYFPCWYNAISEVWFQNQTLMDKYGLQAPENWEEMRACMETVCAAEPNVDGMMFLPWQFEYIFGGFSALFGTRSISPAEVMYDYEKGQWVHALLSNEEAYKKAITAMAEAYAKGWINADFNTWSDAYDAKMNNGEWLFTSSYYNGATTYVENGLDVTFIQSPADEGVTPYVSAHNNEDSVGWIYMISNTSQYPELSCAILELIGSEEYAVAAYWGVEGESYTVGADGKRAYTEAYLNTAPKDRETAFGIARNPTYTTDPFVSNYYVGDALCAGYAKPSLDALIACAAGLSDGTMETYYYAQKPLMDVYDAEDCALVVNAWKTYILENMIRFVLGTKDLGEWDAFMAGLNQYGDMDKVLRIYNEAPQMPLRKQQSERTWLLP